VSGKDEKGVYFPKGLIFVKSGLLKIYTFTFIDDIVQTGSFYPEARW